MERHSPDPRQAPSPSPARSPSAELMAALGPDGALAASLPGWEPRPEQLAMAAAVEAALRERRPLLVEAGTGTGKTLAYLVPAVLSGLKVVISTGTKNLQEQILRKDVPLLAAHLGVPFRAASLKGISNYLCRRRLGDHLAMERARGEETVALERLAAWAATTEAGDRAELHDLADDSPLWREVSSTPETRIGPRCPHFQECFVTRARRAALGADILIVNHHLFFADLALRERWPSAQVLPPYEAVIFDEAHQVEDVATDYFGVTVSSLRLARLASDVQTASALGQLGERAVRAAHHLDACSGDLFTALRARLPRDARIAVGPDLWAGEPARAWQALDTVLEEVESLAAAAPPEDGDHDAGEVRSGLARRARSARDDLALLADRSDRQKVYWGETRGRVVMLAASPVDVAEALRTSLLGQVETAIFTSATLTMEGRFDHVRSRLGLEAAAEARVDSPFDYREQALLYLPRDLPEPADPAFAEAAAARILALVEASGGRAFLLFTSHRQLQVFSHRLAPAITAMGLPLLRQGDSPRPVLLDRFRERPSVLLATASFWEGVDVVGDALQLVVIDKLPFAPPDDPLVAARAGRIEEEGRSGFAEYQVPLAALALAQGFGRLIRHRRDRGVVAILDRRAVLRSYGRRVLSALPADCPRTGAIDDACRFLRGLAAAASPDLGAPGAVADVADPPAIAE